MITEEIISHIESCVLVWLGTADIDGVPNVSPKEVFVLDEHHHFLIANIASPMSEQNIMVNPYVALSLVDIWTQKGFQFKGRAKIFRKEHPDFEGMQVKLEQKTKGLFPFSSVFCVEVSKVKPILAPSYHVLSSKTEDCVTNSEMTYLPILEKHKKNQ